MGNCCGGGENVGEITMMKGGAKTHAGTQHILDERVVAGL